MKKIFPALLAAILLFIAPAYNLLAEDSPEQKELPWEEKNQDQSFIILKEDHETRLNKNWSVESHEHYVIKILKDDAKSLGELPVYYNKSRDTIKDIKAFVTTPDGKKYPYTKMQDFAVDPESPMYSDFRVKVITLPQVSVGSQIEWEIKRVIRRGIIKDQFWDIADSPGVPTKDFKSVYVFPAGKDIKFKAYKDEHAPKIEKTGSTVTYTFEYQETEDPGDGEEYTLPSDEVYGFSMFSSIEDWKVVADWYRELVAKNTITDAGITAKTSELIAGKASEQDKAKAILEFLQDNFRYVSMSFGDNTVEPHPTAEVFNNRYGDCKDWSTLARQMLSIAGIKSNICLFSSEYDGNPENGLPNSSSFNHVILEVFLDGQSYFIDFLLKGYEPGQLPVVHEAAHLLVITDDGYHFAATPVASDQAHATSNTTEIFIEGDGSATYQVSSVWDLDFTLQARETWKSLTDQQKEKFYDMLDETYTRGGKIIERRWDGMDERYGQMKSFLKYKKPGAFPLINDMIILNESAGERNQDFTQKDRKHPIFFPYNSMREYSVTYHIPDGFKLDYVPENYSLNIDFLEIGKVFEPGDRTITVKNIYRTKRATLGPERYQEVKDFWNLLSQKSEKYIILKKVQN